MTDHLHSDCDSLLQSLSELLDGTLSDEMCAEIKLHLESCDNCRAVFNTTRRTIDLVSMPSEGSAGLPEDIRERLFKRLDLEGFLGKPQARSHWADGGCPSAEGETKGASRRAGRTFSVG